MLCRIFLIMILNISYGKKRGDYLQVLNSNGEIEKFKPSRIKKKLLDETEIDEHGANLITNSVAKIIREEYRNKKVPTSVIRTFVNTQLIKRGYADEEMDSRKLGLSKSDFEDLLVNGNRDNANIQYSPEMIAKYASDAISKEYALLTMPKHCSEAHIEGYVHHHDLEYFNTRPNCMNFDLRFFAKNGLKIDGKGKMGSVAKPAKSLEVLLNHMQQAFMAGAVVFSGGQGFANFNTLLAPYAKGRSYKEIKQAIQAFIFNCNMALVCRGGQVLFSSIGMDLSTPEVLANEPAVTFGGIEQGVYADYKEEADLIFKAVCEVIDEKDGNGAYHRFPNTLFNIREGDLDKYEGNCKLLHELGANNPTIYYVNCTKEESTVMGCRTRLPMNYAYNYADDCLNTGNFMYSTLNLPLIAHQAVEEHVPFYTLLDHYCDIIYDTLKFRRSEVEKVLYEYHMSDFLLQKDKDTGKPLYDLNRCTYTIGFCGLNEALIVLEDANDDYDGESIVKRLNMNKEKFNKRDGLRWSVIASPAESTAHRFALINRKKYPNSPIQGTKKKCYLTNSSHIPVSNPSTIVDHIKNADKYHPLTGGGNILHIWLGEVWSDAEALWKLNKKIIETGTIFWAYSKVFTFCQECGFTINDNLTVCPICGSKNLNVYDRITGYYICIDGYNDGKRQEQKERYRQSLG